MELSKKASFEASADAKTLASMLKTCPIGDVLTYDQLSRAVGRSVTTDARSALYTARSIVQKEDRMVFDVVRTVGLKRLSNEEIVDLSDKARDHVRRTSKKTAKKLTCVDYDAMNTEKQVKHNTALSMFCVFAELATEKSTKRLSAQVQKTGTDLPAAKASIAALGLVV
jgi:hypothetical protein